MTTPSLDHAQEIALARFGVIAPLVCQQLEAAAFRAVRESLLRQTFTFPGDRPRRISARTLRRWLRVYQRTLPQGTGAALQALYPQPRADKGVPRAFSAEILQQAVSLRLELAQRTIADILSHLPPDTRPNEATLAHHFRKRGLTRKHLSAEGKAFGRYEAQGVNHIWQSDVTEGFFLPNPTDPTKRKEAYLMGFIDDKSRLITHGEWYFRESLPCLLDCLKKAVLKRGLCSVLYWDNGPIYKAKQVEVVASRLGITIVFSTPYAPEGKGKIERFWKSAAGSFLKEAAHAEIQTLEELNRCFGAWLDRYHQRKHRSTGMTPLARWEAEAHTVRYPNPAEVPDLFLWGELRTVTKTAMVSLGGNQYQVSDALVGSRLEVRYDPLDLATIKVFRDGQFLELAVPFRMTTHTHRKAVPKGQTDKYLPLPSSRRLMDAMLAEQQTTVDKALATLTVPPGSEHRLTLDALRHLLAEALARPLADAERPLAAAFFRRHAPLPADRITRALTTLVETKGADRHLSFYLDELRQQLVSKGGRA